MYFLLGICLAFALLLWFNVAASLTASVFWRVVEKPAQRLSAQSRSQFIFALRIVPLLTTLLFILAFFIPSYFLFEPGESDETISYKLAFAAFFSLIGILLASSRVFATYWRTHRMVEEWMRRGERISIEGVSFPVYRFAHPFPVIAVVGIFRPRMFVAEQIFGLLEAEELAAAVVHEFGHLAARDNFKRTFLRVCRDLVIFPIGKSLEKVWAETAEAAADEYAISTGGKRAAVNLAAALVKIARNIPVNTRPAMPLGSFLIDEQTADVSWRVRRLLSLTDAENDFRRQKTNFNIFLWSGFAVTLLPVLWLATNYDFLAAVHDAMEKMVSILQ